MCKNGQSIHFFVFVFGPKKGGLGRQNDTKPKEGEPSHSLVFVFVVRCKEKGSATTQNQQKVEGLWKIG